jgi:hypothetical protein
MKYEYPAGYTHKSKWMRKICPTTGVRVLISNGIPDHTITTGFTSRPCEVPWYIEMPLNPAVRGGNATSLNKGIIGTAVNGVPLWSAKGKSGNVVPHDDISMVKKYTSYLNAESGSSGTTSKCQWRYAAIGDRNNVSNASTGLVGYALDGFPIYKELPDAAADARLDVCNFDRTTNKYHIRVRAQVNEANGTKGECSSNYRSGDPTQASEWKYILGCFVGAVNATTIGTCKDRHITTTSGPYSDCVLEAVSDDWDDDFCDYQITEDCKPAWYERLLIKKAIIFVVRFPPKIHTMHPDFTPLLTFLSLPLVPTGVQLILLLLICLGVEFYKLYNRHALKKHDARRVKAQAEAQKEGKELKSGWSGWGDKVGSSG